MRVWLANLAAAILVVPQCLSAPPPEADLNGPLHGWFEHQHSIIGNWCCKLADGYILNDADWRTAGGNYEVRIGRAWYRVPPTSVRDPAGGPNPTGRAVVW